jgi:exosortase/archaeosortase family protein
MTALGALVWRDRQAFTRSPHPAWALLAALLTCAAIVTSSSLPPLLRGVAASLAVMAALTAVRSGGQPLLPHLVLALLSLPILSSLQFYLGYPLRVVTAEASAIILSTLGSFAERSGSALTVNGRLVIVDAPCAGIHMAWVAYFTASVAGALHRLDPRRFVARLSCVGLIVLALNVGRNVVLVALESRPVGLGDFWHEATGFVAFVVVCILTLWQMGGRRERAHFRRGRPHRG